MERKPIHTIRLDWPSSLTYSGFGMFLHVLLHYTAMDWCPVLVPRVNWDRLQRPPKDNAV